MRFSAHQRGLPIACSHRYLFCPSIAGQIMIHKQWINKHRTDRAGQALCTENTSVNISYLAMTCTQKTEPDIVVAVAGRVVVAVGRPQVSRIVVPAATAFHTVSAPWPVSLRQRMYPAMTGASFAYWHGTYVQSCFVWMHSILPC